LLPYYNIDDKIVVVIDVFRATSAIITAIQYGVKEIIPVKDIEDALEYKHKGYITAAERKGEVVDGFDFGNSPFAFMEEHLKGQTVVLTTSNCTMAMLEVKHAKKTLLGAFTNITALAEMLDRENDNVLLLCAGWKNRFSLEDTLFAGALVEKLVSEYGFNTDCDSVLTARELYKVARHDMHSFVKRSSHRHRLGHLNIEKDIEYCLKHDQAQAVPQFDGYSVKLAESLVLE
jgi:2-phosphosulfolactate phosphatase